MIRKISLKKSSPKTYSRNNTAVAEQPDISIKARKYASLLTQIQSVVKGEADLIARMANIAAMLHQTFGFWWTGFYRTQGEELVLGPFQGPLACMRIKKGRGVCGAAWQQGHSIVVGNVEQFPGHIACSAESKSEIVIPIIRQGRVVAVLDIDSTSLNTFDSTDQYWLEQIADLV